jgi:hypothetical protein
MISFKSWARLRSAALDAACAASSVRFIEAIGDRTSGRSQSSLMRRSARRCATAGALLLAVSGCSYIEKARQTTDLVVDLAEHYKVEALVQADIERNRLRKARCYSPLLTPATVSAAATDYRLGPTWVDELLRDCPDFAAFLSELTFRRAQTSGFLSQLSMPSAALEPANRRPVGAASAAAAIAAGGDALGDATTIAP